LQQPDVCAQSTRARASCSPRAIAMPSLRKPWPSAERSRSCRRLTSPLPSWRGSCVRTDTHLVFAERGSLASLSILERLRSTQKVKGSIPHQPWRFAARQPNSGAGDHRGPV